MPLQSINPATGETLQTFDTLGPDEVMDRLARATAAFRAWRDTPFNERARLLVRAAAILESESEALGRLMTLEMGKPVRGARIVTGGARLPGPGNYFAPTVLVDVPPGSPAYREEFFGPVASVFRVRSMDEAIRLANDSTFGLGSSVWTNDDAERERFVRELETGQVFVNAMVVSDPRVPFGGVKRSGYGRELGVHGIREFVNVKTVWVAG